MKRRKLIAIAILSAGLSAAPFALAQQTAIPPGTPANAPAKTFSQTQLDQLLAPIALYPDSLLSQVLMSSTYPIEVVQADRWVKTNPGLNGDSLAIELEQQSWDPSVKSLVNFPQVLSMMSDKLDWTTQLGDAFLAQEAQVSDTVQSLRAKAQQAGNLKSTNEQQVTVDNTAGPPEIVIEPTNPQVVYVPVYDPNAIYGPWWYPNDPPYYYYPVGYTPAPGIWFGQAYGYSPAWGYAWGGWDWRHHDVVIDFNRNERWNNRIDRDRYRTEFVRHDPGFKGETGAWQHDPDHRRGVWYRDQGTANRFDSPDRFKDANGRQRFRGRDNDGGMQTGPVFPKDRPDERTGDRGGDRNGDRDGNRNGNNANNGNDGRVQSGPVFPKDRPDERNRDNNNGNNGNNAGRVYDGKTSQLPDRDPAKDPTVRPPPSSVTPPGTSGRNVPPSSVTPPAQQESPRGPMGNSNGGNNPVGSPRTSNNNNDSGGAMRSTPRGDGAFNNMDSGSAARAESQRGSASRGGDSSGGMQSGPRGPAPQPSGNANQSGRGGGGGGNGNGGGASSGGRGK